MPGVPPKPCDHGPIAASTSGSDPAEALAIVNRAISDLKLDSRNPRIHSPRQIRQIARSIDAFGFNVPVLIDRSDKVIAGHGRVMAARSLQKYQVPAICLDHLTESQARAFMLADNKLTENSSWDEQLLGETLRDLSFLDLEFSLEATGFEMGEIDLRIEALDEAGRSSKDPADHVPLVNDGPAVTQVGDIWALGRHRVICGDALHPSTYSLLLDGHQAAMVFTDPPYNVPISGHVSGLGAIQHREFAMASGEMSQKEFTGFLYYSATAGQ